MELADAVHTRTHMAPPRPHTHNTHTHARTHTHTHTRTQDMELEDAVHTALLTLKEGFEGQLSGSSVEVAVIGPDRVFRVLSASEVSDYLQEVE